MALNSLPFPSRWTILGPAGSYGGKRRVEAMCNCGTITVTFLREVTNGRSKSCGCLKNQLSRARMLRRWRKRGSVATSDSPRAVYKRSRRAQGLDKNDPAKNAAAVKRYVAKQKAKDPIAWQLKQNASQRAWYQKYRAKKVKEA